MFIVIMLSFLFFLIYMLWRNDQVYRELSRVLEIILELNTKEIREGKGYTGWRYKVLDEITQLEMLLKFWIPVKSFYKGRKELQP